MTISYIISFITIIILIIFLYFTFLKSTKEHLVELNECKRKNMIKCCTDENCTDDTYGDSKPPFLRKNCEENKINSEKILEKSYEQMFTPAEYNKMFKEINLYNNYYYSSKNFVCQKNKYNKLFDYENNNINNILGEKTFNAIINDNYGEQPGVIEN
jgi:hypothetical protein